MTCQFTLPATMEDLLQRTAALPVIPASPSLKTTTTNPELCQELLNQPPEKVVWAALMGLSPTKQITVRYSPFGEIKLYAFDCPYLQNPKEPYEITIRKKLPENEVVAVVEHLYLTPDAPAGFGTALVSKMIQTLHEQYPILRKIKLHAARVDEEEVGLTPVVGYYFWPRLGFDGLLKPIYRYDQEYFSKLLEQSPYRACQKVSEIMATAAGRLWWRQHGIGLDLEFDLQNQSQLNQWQAYLTQWQPTSTKTNH